MGLLLKDMLRSMSPWVPRLATYVCAAFNKMLTEEKQVCADSSFHSAHLEEEDTSNSGCFFRGKLTHPDFE